MQKVAVMALVAVVAIPIIMGYALNFQEVEHNDYRAGDSQTVTDLLINSEVYSYGQANTYSLNKNNWGNSGIYYFFPQYRSVSDTVTSVPMGYSTTRPAGDVIFSNYLYYSIWVDNTASDYVTYTIHGGYYDGQSFSGIRAMEFIDGKDLNSIEVLSSTSTRIAVYPGATSISISFTFSIHS